MQIVGRRYDTGASVVVELLDGKIRRLDPAPASVPTAAWPWLAPGLIDVQLNGYAGREFNDADLTPETVARITYAQDALALAAYCPTLTTHRDEIFRHSLATIAAACEQDPGIARRVAGIHVEGPYISPADGPRGAHPRQYVRPPDWDEFQRWQDAAGGRIRIITLSPEYAESTEFIARAVRQGVLVAIGHTQASTEQIAAAVAAGATCSTHLGNGAPPLIRRHPNYIWDQLADDRLWASLIVDGHHLPPAVVQSFVRGKTASRCLLVSDITGMAGMPPGIYETGPLGAIEVHPDGTLHPVGHAELLAGAALPLYVGVVNVMRFAQVDLLTAIHMASLHPAQWLQRPPPELAVGAPADLIQFHLDLESKAPATAAWQHQSTILAGQVVAGEAFAGTAVDS
ncbi:MAG: N-acetylglucosamine-6-phosphate deacetylase [Planctomycetota bacterium]